MAMSCILSCPRRVAVLIRVMAIMAGASAAIAQAPPPSGTLQPDPALVRALEAPHLTDDERQDLRIRHGLWFETDLDTPLRRATVALDDCRLNDPALDDPTLPVELRAEVCLRRGEFEAALALLPRADSARALRVRLTCLDRLGRLDEIEQARLALPRGADPLDSAEAIPDLVQSMVVRSRVSEGEPGQHEAMMALLARARGELDRLDWRSRLAEAELLLDKDNPAEAAAALEETLRLHPRLAEAWMLYGRTAIDRFDFAGAENAAKALRSLDPDHPLANLIDARAALVRNDPDAAETLVDSTLAALPNLPEALSLQIAIDAARYDFESMREGLAELDARWPGHPEPWLEAGRQLSIDRQYPEAAEILGEAARRRPLWPTPRIDLALLEVQSGRDAIALAEFREIAKRDPYNRRAANGLALLESIAAYKRIRSEHFEIRYADGVDEVVAVLMPEVLDRMHEEVSGRFGHVPPNPTVIEVHPDHRAFAVRITGMPWVHTVAACTGPVIAMEVPRRGPPKKHLGPFDWLEVLRHEYAHTVTLSQTRNRVPHWLTEAAATSVETLPRDYQTCLLLSRSLLADELLSFDEIDWAFVRPKKPTDRALAYAQGRWMLEFMEEAHGPDALVALMDRFREGESSRLAFAAVLGVPPEAFESRFLEWARDEVAAWGLAPEPSMSDLIATLPEREDEQPKGSAVDDATLAAWILEHPDHPDLLELALRRGIGEGEVVPDDLMPLLERYAVARPVDPYPHRVLARAYIARGDALAAIPHLAALDGTQRDDNAYAAELARLHRQAGDTSAALESVMKAVRIDPYDASLRELAAAIAIEASDLALCRLHLEALVLLEPDRPQHRKRLEAFERRFGEG
ncbi:MAG: tetratricopeptide repeat protein [Phycisphaerales bacterium]